MNRLILGAKGFSVEAAREQRLRRQIRRQISDSSPTDTTDVRKMNRWDKVAKGFRLFDPAWRKLAFLFLKIKQ